MARPKRVLIVDDHPGFRASVRRLLEGQGFEIVGEAADGAQALRCAAEVEVDLILLDIHLPDLDGRDVAGRLGATPDAPAIVLISSRDIDDLDDSVERAGARGFISKAELSGDALAALLR
ncbi:MAG TPA: response regulator transcription factor [Solirubrobacterales bacterium]|nr:response regulator transcription factor [Solirubrobacterales bacterium]